MADSGDAPEPLSQEELAVLRQLMNAAPPPWTPLSSDQDATQHDTEFAAAARVAMPWLLDFAQKAGALLHKLERAPLGVASVGCAHCRVRFVEGQPRHKPGCELLALLGKR